MAFMCLLKNLRQMGYDFIALPPAGVDLKAR